MPSSRCCRSTVPLFLIATLAVAGCQFPVQETINESIRNSASRPLDSTQGVRAPSSNPSFEKKDLPLGPAPLGDTIPRTLPGADAKDFNLPKVRDPLKPQELEEALRREFPQLEELEKFVDLTGKPLELAELQRLAAENHPLVRQATADVQAARGAAIQAGLYPNPTIGYQGDQIGDGGVAGQQGGFINQTIITYGKLKLAQAAAWLDVLNSRLTLQRVRAELAAKVRGQYFAVMVARENLRIRTEIVLFSEKLAQGQMKQVEVGRSVAADAAQARVLSLQARAEWTIARNRVDSAWRQLSATVGVADMAPAPLADKPDLPVPLYDYETVKNRVLEHHTDLRIAENLVKRDRYLLELALATPKPNLQTNGYLEKDYATNTMQIGLQFGMTVPIWDRNQGNIIKAQANLASATTESKRVKVDLAQKLADAFERYKTHSELLKLYRDQILPEQVRAFRAIRQRYQQEEGKINFSDIVLSQQTLAGHYTSYLNALAGAWQAVADVSQLLQTDDLFQPVSEKP